MFGLYRTLLALMVVVGHIYWPATLGTYAVFGFYALSGYLMTTIMHDTYGYTMEGRKRYLLNRALRLYPAYWLSCIVSLLLIAWIGSAAMRAYHEVIYIPGTVREVLGNLFLMFHPVNYEISRPRLSPPTWALTIEIVFYVLICLGISRTRTRTLVWLSLSIVYTIYLYFSHAAWSVRYYPVGAASLPFATGSILYYVIKEERFRQIFLTNRLLQPAPLMVLMIGNYCLAHYREAIYRVPSLFGIAFYLNLVIVFLMIASIAYGNAFPMLTRKVDRWIGNLSYPVYLLHYQIAAIVSVVLYGAPLKGPSSKGLVVLLVSLPLLILASYALALCVDAPVERIRSWVKQRKVAQTEQEQEPMRRAA